MSDPADVFTWQSEIRDRKIDCGTFFASGNAEQLLGVTIDTLENFGSFLSLIHTDDRAHFRRNVEEVLDADMHYSHAEYRIIHESGANSAFAGSVHPMRLGRKGELQRIVGFSRKIAGEKHQRPSSNAIEPRFRVLADAAPVMIWISGTDKLCWWFNSPWLLFVGRLMQQEVGNGWTENVHRDDFDRCLQIYTSCFDARTPFTMEYRLRRHDGVYRWILDNGVPHFGENQVFEGYIGSCIDIENLKQAEAKLLVIDRMKRDFLANLSHELRNPLAPIRNGIEILKLAKEKPHAVERAANMMERHLLRMVQMIDDLLEVSRLERQTLVLQKTRISLAALTMAAVETSAPVITHASQQLIISSIPKSVYLIGDEARLIQAISTLLNNSSRHSGKHQRIWLSVEASATDVTVEVRDEGIGMTQETLEEIASNMLPFETSGTGHGVGLSLTRQIVALHEGTLTIKSAGLGRGCVILMKLRRDKTEEGIAPAARADNEARGSDIAQTQ